MRAKVASRAGGHAFEERFLNLEGLQLNVAYRQAIRDEKEQADLIGAIHKNWATRFDDSMKALMIFTNPALYKSWEDIKELDKYQAELKPEEFSNVWDELMQFIPQEVHVEDTKSNPLANVPILNSEVNEFLTGFVPYHKRMKEGDGTNGDE
jgi:hypothetical protein